MLLTPGALMTPIIVIGVEEWILRKVCCDLERFYVNGRLGTFRIDRGCKKPTVLAY